MNQAFNVRPMSKNNKKRDDDADNHQHRIDIHIQKPVKHKEHDRQTNGGCDGGDGDKTRRKKNKDKNYQAGK